MRFEYDEETKGKNPFWIDKLTPIQIATFDLDEYRRVRGEFTTDEWIDLVVRSMGYEPGRDVSPAQAALLGPADPLDRAELQPRGAWAREAQARAMSSRRSRLTRRCSREGPRSANLFGHMTGTTEGHGPDLGCRRLRRGRGSPEDAQGSHHDDEDLLRVGHVPARPGGRRGRCQHRDVRQHQPAHRRHGPDRATSSRRCRT